MLKPIFHAWERRLASVSTDRVVRPFEWGLDWIPRNGHPSGTPEAEILGTWVASVMGDTDAFFTAPPTTEYEFAGTANGGGLVTFPSAFETPHTTRCTAATFRHRDRERDLARRCWCCLSGMQTQAAMSASARFSRGAA